MFAKKVESVIWMNNYTTGDRRRNFCALYVFDDGYETEEECLHTVNQLFQRPKQFATIRFCGQWYAINLHGCISHIVLTKEHVYYSEGFERYKKISLEKAEELQLTPASYCPDEVAWQDGIQVDLMQIDNDIQMQFGKRRVAPMSIEANNILICFGHHFFASEICIRTNDYANHVLSAYYNDQDLEDIADIIIGLRKIGYKYYNPFSNTASYSYREKKKKEKQMLNRAAVEETIMIPWQPDGTKTMRPREIQPPNVIHFLKRD